MYARPSINALSKQGRASALSISKEDMGKKGKTGMFNSMKSKKALKHKIITDDAEAFSF
jgi:hypothetical protein